jgi:hypothetical protein
MRGIRFAAFACAAALSLVAPSAAIAEEDLGEPDVEQAYNDGEQGFIALAYGLGVTGGARRLNADCNFVLFPAVSSSTTQVLVVAQATAQSGDLTVNPAAVGVDCSIHIPNQATQTVSAARPGAAGFAAEVFTIRLGEITLCATPSVLWDDNVFQKAATPRCKAT